VVHIVIDHLAEHFFIYLGLLLISLVMYWHVFYDCWRNEPEHKQFLNECRVEREDLERLLDKLQETKGQCPLYQKT